ncbi:MAG: FAD-dependent oxidoreductase [Desulfobacterales bacterium]|jgi:NADH oxidase (H2O2-forming)|nr:FAD-dependent oxidoreductase [Desulfobacteraceae bacterium]MBT4363121.1 FAD-dependent oxidoreductase [Desulfobacteraceae bacterium]MBT7086197.1 FAD-dependent oxidoreductase [Desulfobacterales bacterium]MBT7695798.1 FAD-dependent oxidoreductase [Desulfobacterales bacterium]
MEKVDVLIIGGSAAGIVAATTGKSFYPGKEFMVVRKEEKVLVPCGIPYMFGTLESSEKNIMPDAILENAGIKLKIDEVVKIDQENKICKTLKEDEICFEKLIIATGSEPATPTWLKGSNLENVFLIPKDKTYLDKVINTLHGCKDVVVIGGGFIGVEVADELAKHKKNITIVELMPHILSLAFDKELAVKLEEILESRGIQIKTGEGVREIIGNGKVKAVVLNNEEKIKADAVILCTGYRPNTALAKKSGIAINDMGFIKVNEYMRTKNPDIFAIGDCAEKYSFLTRTLKGVMLASTACAEARIAGMNLFKLSTVRSFGGTIAIFSTSIGDTAFGAAGVTESLAKERGFDILSGIFEGIDKHPGTLPGTQKQIVKLIVSKDSGIILGGEVIGGQGTGELTNLIGYAIQNRMTINSILTSQIGTHPLLTAPPTAYPLIKAAESIAKKQREGF